MSDVTFEHDLFLLLGYLLSSADGLYGEPAGYGPFRLVDAARRLLAAMAKQSALDPYLERLYAVLEEACSGAVTDDELHQLLGEVLAGYATELRARLDRAAT